MLQPTNKMNAICCLRRKKNVKERKNQQQQQKNKVWRNTDKES